MVLPNTQKHCHFPNSKQSKLFLNGVIYDSSDHYVIWSLYCIALQFFSVYIKSIFQYFDQKSKYLWMGKICKQSHTIKKPRSTKLYQLKIPNQNRNKEGNVSQDRRTSSKLKKQKLLRRNLRKESWKREFEKNQRGQTRGLTRYNFLILSNQMALNISKYTFCSGIALRRGWPRVWSLNKRNFLKNWPLNKFRKIAYT